MLPLIGTFMVSYYEDILLACFTNKIYSFDDNFVLFFSEKNSFSFNDGTCTGYNLWRTVPGNRSFKGQQNEGLILYIVGTEPASYVSLSMFD